ncbi:MAG: LPS-assembly protein LptD [Rhodocyclaceae bacterium]|nr:LPS-assembly protein LptD [Rhodocyclaceae bacterium]
MSLAWLKQALRQAILTIGWLMLASLGGLVSAGENLPPLRVDPALLGGAPLKPVLVQPVAAKPAPSVQPQAVAPVAAVPQPRLPAPAAPAVAISHPATTPFASTDKQSGPTFVTANKVDGINDVEVIAEGDARLERAGDTLSADRIVYRQLEDEVEAIGKVRLASPDTEITGPRLRMRLEESTGEFASPAYTIKHQPPPVPEPALTLLGLPTITEGGQVLATTGRMIARPVVTGSGVADRLEFRGKDQFHLENATYSTCAPGKRDWEVAVDALDLDYTGEVGTGRNAVVRFKDVPIFYVPWMNFSLNNQKKSGFLPPTIGSTSKSGLEITAPWFWNIAPNMDATITPRLMSRRGVQLNTEFRYLLDTLQNRTQPGLLDKGQVRVEYLPGDQMANRDRYGYSILHNQILGQGFAAALNLNGVSDDDYFSDLSTRISQVSQGNLLRQGMLTYGGPWYSAALNVQTYQTLQSLAKPYQRLPQLTGTAFRYDLPLGLAFNLNAEYVNFDHPTDLLGKRTTFYPQLSLPLATAAFSLTPKIGVHSTHYALDGQNRPAAVSAGWSTAPATQSRAIPIFNVDGGFVMERNTDWFGKSLTQTLEPRAFYLYVPRRDQSKIPVFDTGIAGFNYAQMFSENRYAGGDRIGDANELTLAVTSRLLDPASGADLLRATLGTRYYFTDQHVTLPGETARTERSADILATLAGQVLPHTYADIGWQYNPRDARTDRLTLGGRYRPEAGKVVNAGYRYARDLLGQVDVSAQWPLFGGWHGVGRYNYSTKERRIIEIIGGLEYDAGCWVGRFVVQRLATIADQPTTALFFQLELNDFSRIGSNPLQLLRRNIPGYGVINQPTADPVFAEN